MESEDGRELVRAAGAGPGEVRTPGQGLMLETKGM